MSLTPKERVLAQINHQETDYIPYTIRLTDDVAQRLDAHYGCATWRRLVDDAIRALPSPVPLVTDGAGPLVRDVYGSLWRIDRRPFHLVEAALRGPSLQGPAPRAGCGRLVFPDVDSLCTPEWEQQARRAAEENKDHFLVATLGNGLFERSWALLGFEEALMAAVAEPAFYAGLLERLADHQLAIVDRLLELPVDGIFFGDDWGYQEGVLLGPARWRRLIKPHYARIYARVHAAGKLTLSHCCGSVAEILPDIIEMGLDVLESVQPEARGMNPYELKRRFGADITFWGGLGSQSLIPFGTPAEIHAEVERLCLEMGRGGGYILSPAKPLQPETPVANAAAVVEAFLTQAGVSDLTHSQDDLTRHCETKAGAEPQERLPSGG